MVAGLLAIVGVVLWLRSGKPAPTIQTPTQPSGIVPAQTGAPATPAAKQPAIAQPSGPTEPERQAQEALRHQAVSFVAREGSYTSSDGFAALKSVYTEVTPAVQTFLEGERTRLAAAHPASGAYWGQTTKSVSSKITSSDPVLTSTSTQVQVQTQVTVEETWKADVITYQVVTVNFQKQDNAWQVVRIERKPFEP